MKIHTPILFIFLSHSVIALKIYESNGALDKKVISGLKYKNDPKSNRFDSNNFTACIRSKLKRLPRDESGKLLVIHNLKVTFFQERNELVHTSCIFYPISISKNSLIWVLFVIRYLQKNRLYLFRKFFWWIFKVSWDDFKQNCNYFQWDLSRVREHASEVLNMFFLKI